MQKGLLKVFLFSPLLSLCTFCIIETPAGKQWKSWPFLKISYPASSFWNHVHAYLEIAVALDMYLEFTCQKILKKKNEFWHSPYIE